VTIVFLVSPNSSQGEAEHQSYRFWTNTEDAKVAEFGALNNFGLTFGKRIYLTFAIDESPRDRLIYLTDEEVASVTVYAGDRQPLGALIAKYQDPMIGSVGIPIPTDPQVTAITLEIETREFLAIRPALITFNAVIVKVRSQIALKISFVTTILLLALFNFIGAFIFRARIFVFFGLYCLGIGALLVQYLGLFSFFIPSASPYFSDSLFLLSHTLSAGFFYAFISEFLHLKEHSPKVHKIFQFGLVATLSLSLLGLIFTNLALVIIPVSGLISGILIFLAAISAFRRSTNYIRVYLFSWVFFLLFIALYTLSLVGISPDYFLFGYELPVAMVLDISILLIAVGLKVRFDEHAKLLKLAANRDQFERHSRLASLGLLAGGIAHEINNPLSIIKAAGSNLQYMLSKGFTDATVLLRVVAEIDGTVTRISNIIHTLRVLASGRKLSSGLHVQNLAQVIAPITAVLASNGMNRQATIVTEGWNDSISIACDTVSFSQVIMNLIANGLDAAIDDGSTGIDGGWLRLEASAKGEKVHIRVSNSGPKMSPAVAQQIFEPFFTTKIVGQGMGLGLSISKALAEMMGATLEVDLTEKNTAFVLTFPRYEKKA
jgi:signal transduction histidine kinase